MPTTRNRPASLRTEVSMLATTLQRLRAHRRTRALVADTESLPRRIQALQSSGIAPGAQSTATQAGTSSMYLRTEEGQAGSRVARWLMGLCDLDQVAQRRRANYQGWASLVKTLPHCRALFNALPQDCTPYMFPLLIEHPEPHFYLLKRLGMQSGDGMKWPCPAAARPGATANTCCTCPATRH